MERSIDRDISHAERDSLLQQNAALVKQNELLKRELQQLKEIHANSQRELGAYKKLVLFPGGEAQGEVLELQHQRIFELETQVEVLQGKYGKLVRASGSDEQTDLALRVRDLERRLKDSEADHQRQLRDLRDRLSKQSALEFAESKRLITSPTGEVKKSSLAVRKFV